MFLSPSPQTRKGWWARLRTFTRSGWRRIVPLNDSPERIAAGAAVGCFLGWLPLMGVQMPLALGFAWLLKVNPIAAMVLVWISNPLTVLLIYFIIYRVGTLFIGGGMSWHEIAGLWEIMHDMSLVQAMYYFMVEMFRSIFLPMFIGGVFLGLAFITPCYLLVLKLVIHYKHRHINRRALWATLLRRTLIEPPPDTDVDLTDSERKEASR